MTLTDFHPLLAQWFKGRFASATDIQQRAWTSIGSGQNTLIAAPTGSGKTLAAFLSAIDALIREDLESGLPDETRVLYVSPLKALSADIQQNLQTPLDGINRLLGEQGEPEHDIRAWVRTGDTPQSDRERMRRRPPHIVVTTPESLYLLVTSASGRAMLATVQTVIVDEIHALAGAKRGSHLALTLERLTALCPRPPVRIGLSATQKPIERIADFLAGRAADTACTIIDAGHVRARDLAIELPASPLTAVMSTEVWQEVYDRLAELIENHATTLIFVNTRRLAERAARYLGDRLGTDNVTAHHGSLAKEHRLDAEQHLKAGNLRALVATASLELGIDIGDIDLVCQLGSPHSIAALLQRVGRSGHAFGATPKGRLFPLSRDDLVECVALLDAIQRDELDAIELPEQPLDVLAQQIVAEVAARDWDETALFHIFQRAWPYRELKQATYLEVLHMLANGFTTRRGRRGAYLHWDRVNGRLRSRQGARLVALTNGGVIPDQFDYDVVLTPQGISIGTLNEDFAFESLPGDIFQLGNTSYRIAKVDQGKVFVEDAHGQPPNIPFWFGEAPGRSDALSLAVSRLRQSLALQLATDREAACEWLIATHQLNPSTARQLVDYLGAAREALGVLPSQQRLVLERFFDERGDMHLVIHAPFGSRLNRAWGLALRKRFCRKFNFELQAAALEDSIVLSLGATHSFRLDEVAGYLKSDNVREVLIQALLDAPLFATRWRWNATIALAIRRNYKGKKAPPQFQRIDAEDLIAVIFPDQLACIENIAGSRDIPEHPLVDQTLTDCLHDSMDIAGLEHVLRGIEQGVIEVITHDATLPSPLAEEILAARAYAFLDDAPAEERRTQAVRTRNAQQPQQAGDTGQLEPDAIERVRAEVWPQPRDADELHDALVVFGFLTAGTHRNYPDHTTAETVGWQPWFDALAAEQRATRLSTTHGQDIWVAAERLGELQAVCPRAALAPPIEALQAPTDSDTALREVLRSRLEGMGPVTLDALAAPLGLAGQQAQAALATLEQEGFVIQGRFTPNAVETQWCERRLLARIHRYTLKRQRQAIQPVSAATYMRFLFDWHGLTERGEGQEALLGAIHQLEGFPIAAAAWEADILPARIEPYQPQGLDNLCASGQIAWLRLSRDGNGQAAHTASTVRNTPIALLARPHLDYWHGLARQSPGSEHLSGRARQLADFLGQHGASFFGDLVKGTGRLRSEVEQAVGELVARGWVTADSFAGLRALTTAHHKRPRFGHRGGRSNFNDIEQAGRWALLSRPANGTTTTANAGLGHEALVHIAWVLLQRYGVVFRRVLARETGLPPWRELLYVYRRMEARGEIRGGRFVEGFSGEQFALIEALKPLREQANQDPGNTLIRVSASDPLNLAGIITPGRRVPATSGNQVLYRCGVPLVQAVTGELEFLADLSPELKWQARNLLLRRHHPAGFSHRRH